MKDNFESKLKPKFDPEYYEEKYKEADANLFDFKNEIQLEVYKNIREDEEIQKLIVGEASKHHSSASDFNTFISIIVAEQSPILRGKIYKFLLDEAVKSDDPAELLKINMDNINEFIDDDKKEELVSNLTGHIKDVIISKEESSIAV